MDLISTFQEGLKINRTATKFIFGAYLLIIVAIYVFGAIDGDYEVFFVAIYLVVLAVIVFALAGMSGVLRQILMFFFSAVIMIWISLVLYQVATGNDLHPRVNTYNCLVYPIPDDCKTLRKTAEAADDARANETASVVAVPMPPSSNSQLPMPTNPVAMQPQMATENTVYVQFAAFPRGDVVDLATALVGDKWNVQGADRGGERLASADGLNEVRYFHEDDFELAMALALDTGKALDKEIKLLDLSKSKYSSKVDNGHLELWISK